MSFGVLLLLLKLALWVSARSLLPLLFGHARHASLDQPPSSSSSSAAALPRPATAPSSHSLHDDDDDDDEHDQDLYTTTSSSPFFSRATLNKLKSLRDVRNTLIAPLRFTHNGVFHLHNFSAFLFSLAFEETATLYLAVLLESAGFDTSEGSAIRGAFKASLFLVIQLAVVLIPLGICLLFTYRTSSSTPLSRRLIYLSLPFIPWLVLFFSVPLPSALSSPSNNSSSSNKSAGILNSLLARTAVIGVTLIALLSGSAAMAATWEAVEQWRGKSIRPPTQADINLAHDSFDRACSDLEAKRVELQRLERERENVRVEGGGGSRWKLSNLWSGDARSREIKTLQSEIFGLSAIASAMRDDLDTMSQLSRRDRRSRTLSGRVLVAIGWCWAVYCAFRIVFSMLNLLILGYRDTTPPDFISLSLASFLRLFDVQLDVAVWTKQISLVFVGVLIWARIGSVLSYLGRAFRAASAGRGVETCFLVLVLSEVMTIYLLATLIQLRTSLPPSPLLPSVPLLSLLPSFQIVFGSLFDTFFLLSSFFTAAYLYFLAAQRSQSGGGGVLFGAAMD